MYYRQIHQLNWNKFNHSNLSLNYASTEIAGFISYIALTFEKRKNERPNENKFMTM